MSRIRALGVDISHWQGVADFPKMKKNGASFVILKASQNNFADKVFKENWGAAKDAGILRGAYHFFDMRDGSDAPKLQADYFCSILEEDMGELLPVLDFESPGVAGYPEYPSHEECVSIVTQFCERVKKNLKFYPMIYTNLAGIQRLSPLTSMLKSLDLWIAWYNTKSHTPQIGSWPDWRYWQYKSTGDGHAFGVDSLGIDMNAFNGTVDDLYDYANRLGVSKRRLTK